MHEEAYPKTLRSLPKGRGVSYDWALASDARRAVGLVDLRTAPGNPRFGSRWLPACWAGACVCVYVPRAARRTLEPPLVWSALRLHDALHLMDTMPWVGVLGHHGAAAAHPADQVDEQVPEERAGGQHCVLARVLHLRAAALHPALRARLRRHLRHQADGGGHDDGGGDQDGAQRDDSGRGVVRAKVAIEGVERKGVCASEERSELIKDNLYGASGYFGTLSRVYVQVAKYIVPMYWATRMVRGKMCEGI
eukprot:6494645-Pyramimonas_sp.AAC.1